MCPKLPFQSFFFLSFMLKHASGSGARLRRAHAPSRTAREAQKEKTLEGKQREM
jgi:hypothetical protein